MENVFVKLVFTLVILGFLLIFMAAVIQSAGFRTVADHFGYTGLGLFGAGICTGLIGFLVHIWSL